MRRRKWLVAGLLCAGFAIPAEPAAGANCPVSNASQVNAALAMASCDPITLAPGTYASNYNVTRTVTLDGAGPETTTLQSDSGASMITTSGASTVTLRDLTVTGTTTAPGISAVTDLVLDRVVVRNNTTSGDGGGLLWNKVGGTLTVTDSAFRDNIANGFQGGGAALINSGTATFDRVLFEGNKQPGPTSAGGGGGLTALGSTTLTNVTMTGNRSNANGGGFRFTGGTTFQARLNNVTIAGNTADNNGDMLGAGGGIASEGSNFAIANSIIANNNRAAFDDDCASVTGGQPLARLGYELIEAPGGCTFGNAGPFTDTAAGYLTGVDPQLAPLADTGGPTETMAIFPTSPAFDAGNPATPGSGGAACDALDQRRLVRGGLGMGRCDLGAYEAISAEVATPPGSLPLTAPATATKKKCKKGQKLKKVKGKRKCVKKKKRKK